jgi:glutathione S-transferase
MSFKKNDLRSPGYLALNPEGKVPTLLVDKRPLTEVAAILYYLAKRFPDAELLPRDDIEADAQALSWMSFAASTLHPARRRGLDYANESMQLPTGAWEAAGRSAAIRSPTSICFACIGGSPIRSSQRPKPFPISPRIIGA